MRLPPSARHETSGGRGDLTEGQWRRLAPLLPPATTGGRPRRDDRRVVDGVLWVAPDGRAVAGPSGERGGRPVTFALTGGERHELEALPALLDGGAVKRPGPGRPRLRPDRIAGDRGYSSGAARDGLRRRGIGSVIPQPRNQRPWAMVDWSAYRERNKVERLSCRLEPLRGDLVRGELDGAPAPSRARLRRRSCATRGDPRVASRRRRTDGRAFSGRAD